MSATTDLAHNGFHARNIQAAPEDPLYRLMREYRQDTSVNKIDLGVGAYRDDDGKPWVLPTVIKAKAMLAEDPEVNHEYLPIQGLQSFTEGAARLILGADGPAIKEDRIASIQTVSGTGAVHLGATLLYRFFSTTGTPTVYISDPTWPNHKQIFGQLGFKVEQYPYFSRGKQGIDVPAMLACLRAADRGSVVVLQACAHNPTGLDPTADEWDQIAQVMRERGHFPFFNCAYQGFATGFECCVAQSFAKNLGLYGERVGAFHFVCAPGVDAVEASHAVASQMALISRAEISNPPAFGSRIADRIINDPELFAQWQQDLETMSSRLIRNRQAILKGLEARGTRGKWGALSGQIGMFSFMPLSKSQIERLRVDYHIYMTENARISVAGLNNRNLEYFIEAIDKVVRGDYGGGSREGE
ncbi:hypothetical protein LCI18_002631 [Fusarium solani-melongenae]|uniref:Uncharacterized protein n=1 Tax=Fusarium solani subsp. cucurbitae TaxID=2747967 RepID=A0ACD3YS34_FUSSC|nr:hypothetical protein LCI18_002631 [Fusarium solani-melongenae]